MNLQSLRQPESLFRGESLIQGRNAVGIEVVHDKDHLLGMGVFLIQKPFDLGCPDLLGPAFAGMCFPPAAERFGEHEDAAGPVPYVFTVLEPGMVGI